MAGNTRSKPARPDGFETPGLDWRPRSDHWVAYWIARADIVSRGYSLKTQRLWPPSWGEHPAEPSDAEWLEIATQCRRLQDEMLRWARGGLGAPKGFDGTLAALIEIYRTDTDSPYRELRHQARMAYDSNCGILTRAIGKSELAHINFRQLKRWYTDFRSPREPDGRERVARAHGLMSMLRCVFGFGAALEYAHCGRIKAILSEMRFTNVAARTEQITAEQAIAIRRRAHEVGRPSIALAQAIQFELMLRQKDVIGEWVPVDEPGLSDVVSHGKKWLGGLRWREVSPDLILTHRISKSVRGRAAVADRNAGKIESYDLREYPMIMEEMHALPGSNFDLSGGDRAGSDVARSMDSCIAGRIGRGDARHAIGAVATRSGPLVIDERTGLPWPTNAFGRHWRRIATAVGVPATAQNRDSRAGAVTEASAATEDFDAIREHASHSHASMTARYSRSTVKKKNKVARLRVARRGRDERPENG